MKALFAVAMLLAPALTFASCPTPYPQNLKDNAIIEAEVAKHESNGVFLTNCKVAVQDVIDANASTPSGTPGYAKTSITVCDGENPKYNSKFSAYLKIVRFTATGRGESDSFSVGGKKCPTDDGSSVTLTFSTISQ